MFSLLFRRRSDSRAGASAINSDVEDLIRTFGVNAYEEARRRRSESHDFADARRWSAVKSEIGRRILAACGGAATLEGRERLLFAEGLRSCTILDRPADRRPKFPKELKGAIAQRIERGEEELERIFKPSEEDVYCGAA